MSIIKVVMSWDALPPLVEHEGFQYSTRVLESKYRKMEQELQELRKKKDDAMELIERYGGVDGGHHKQWVLDQIVRILSVNYESWVKEYEDGEGGSETYFWDVGIPP